MRRFALPVVLLLLAGAAGAADQRKTPYWASITAGDALMRTGPGQEYPAVWRYRRAGLPVKVIAIHESWRKVREVDGTEGWMKSVLIGDQRTAMVTGEVRALRARPDAGAAVAWRAEPGVIGRLSHCAAGWCEVDVKGRAGFVEAGFLWGVDPGETVE